MKKVAIVTLNGYFNYGNRLQNYALQETIKYLGFSVDSIRICDEDLIENSSISLASRLVNLLNNNPKEIFKILKNKVYFKIHEKDINEIEKNRLNIFKKFSNDYINETDYYISEKNIPEDLTDRYDYFITGSDQVWNMHYNKGSSIYFLTFAESHKRIAYAPSFGVNEIDTDIVDKYKEWISGIHKISVREDEGAKIIKKLTGREALVLIDPTLLLSKDKWLSIAKEAKNKPKGKYLLTYFLGGVNSRYGKQIRKFAKQNNLEVINLGCIKEKETYQTGPSEFIDYISNCSIMFTDSFHGTVFSILFEKPFVVFERRDDVSMYSRIDTLLDKFNLSSRKVENISYNNIFNIDYSHVPHLLHAERVKALDFLKDALEIKDAK